MLKQRKDYTLIYIGAISSAFFMFLLVNHYVFRIDDLYLGIVRETISIPFAIVHLIVLIRAISEWDQEKYRRSGPLFWLIVTMVLTIVLFFLVPELVKF